MTDMIEGGWDPGELDASIAAAEEQVQSEQAKRMKTRKAVRKF